MSEDTQTEEATDTAVLDKAGEEEFQFVEDPKFDIDYKGECAYEVKVEIATANEDKKAEELYDELKSDAELPGFRRGKAPVQLIERKFGKYVKAEVSGKLVAAAFQKLVKDEDLKPLGYPDVDGLDEDEEERKEGTPLEFTLKFEVSPRVELGKYRGVEIERPVVTIDKKDIDEAVDSILERSASFEAMGKTAKAKDGDQVVIDFKGTVKGEEFQGGSAENYPYILGSKRFFPEFEEVLVGMKPGEEVKTKVKFPADYFAEELQKKSADFTITVHELKRKKKPKLDDDFAEQNGYESAKDLRAKTEEQLKEHSVTRSTQITEARALEAVVDDSKFEIPASLIDSVTEEQRNQRIRQMIEARISPEQMAHLTENLEDESRVEAVASIKRLVVVNEIGEAEGIEVNDGDFEKEATNMAQSVGAEVELVAQYLSQGEQRNQTMERIFRTKTLAVIIDNAKVTETELTREEMEKAEDGPEAASGDE